MKLVNKLSIVSRTDFSAQILEKLPKPVCFTLEKLTESREKALHKLRVECMTERLIELCRDSLNLGNFWDLAGL